MVNVRYLFRQNTIKLITHRECAFHSFRTSRSGTHRTTEEPVAVCGAEDSGAGRAPALMRIEKYGAGGEKLSQAQMQLFELAPVVSEMIEHADSEHAPVRRPTRDQASIRAARNCLRIFRASSGFCLARRISACANAAAKKPW